MKKRNRGFTLIELLVTIALMSIFSVFALRLFTNGFILHNDYRARSLEFFEDTVKKSKAEKLLKEHPIRCDQKGTWTFNSENSDSLMNLFPYKASRCAHKAGGWIVIYAEGFSTLGRM
jgi:prepilin-type N-terminal cleavage/methylation domain-containing protein